MLKLYYARPSAYVRPVWLALLEKQLPFELVPVNLGSGEQFEPAFLNLNPFGHVPVLMDDSFRVIESLAILDYLEAKYPEPPLLPTDAATLAKVRMVQMVALNELLPALVKLVIHDEPSADFQYAQRRAVSTLNFLEQLLDSGDYFADQQLTLAEIVAGTFVYRLPDLGVALTHYPKLQSWSNRLLLRSSWQQIELTPEEWQGFKRRLRVLPKIWERRRHHRINA